MVDNLVRKVSAIRYRDGCVEQIAESVVEEDLITLFFNGIKFITLVATNDSLKEFGAGFFIAAGIASSISSVKVDGLSINVEGKACVPVSPSMESFGESCSTSSETISTIPLKASCITPDEIFKIRKSLDDDAWCETGGLHSSVLFYQHKIVMQFSDIGRHNAVDKAIGYMVLHGYNSSDCAIGSTGREPFGMVQKVANAGIPLMISRAATTTAGIDLAQKSGITLICFTRDRRFTIYTHPERVVLP